MSRVTVKDIREYLGANSHYDPAQQLSVVREMVNQEQAPPVPRSSRSARSVTSPVESAEATDGD